VKVGVCVKVVPDTDTRIKIAGSGAGIDESGVKWIVSPYDAFAVEEGVATKEAHGGECVLYSVGPQDWGTQIRASGLAVGADRGILVDDPGLQGADGLAVARALAAAVAADGIEVLFTGKQAIDDDNVQVPAMVAEFLGWPHVSFVSSFKIEGTSFTATRNVGGGVQEVVSGLLPVVITADRGLNNPRYAKLPDIMKAKKKPVDTKTLADLGLTSADVAPGSTITGWSLPPERSKGRKLSGDVDTMVAELVRLLREEAKVL
jgi:electron transfer flavoprotein beta subunit